MMQRGQKRKQDEEEALNKALRTFEDDFGGLVKPPVGKAFVRGDVVENNKTISAASGKIYQPDAKFSLKLGGSLPSTASNFEEAKKLAAEKARKFLIEAHKGSGPAPTVVVPTTAKPIAKPARPGASKAVKSKTTNLDAFKEELKRVQEERDKRKGLREHLKNELGVDQAAIDKIAPVLDKPYAGNGEFDDDPYTTNLYICNLPQDVVMEDILDTFGSFGPLASAKILYPRTDEEKRREHLCGFVAYMCRQDADRAIASLQHALEINGELVKISFARPVVIPPQPFYVPPGLQALTVPDDYTGLPFNAKPITEDVENWRKRFGDLPVLSSALPQDWSDEQLTTYNQMIKNATIRVVIPTDSSLLHIIHRTIEFVIREGPIFEAMLMGRENQNPVYRFLFETHHPAHVYYRWKLYTILQGERLDTWRMGKYRMFENGSWWEPPPPACELLASMPKSLYYLACNNMNPERWFPTLTQKKEARESRFIREKKEMIARVEQERKKKTALNKIDFKELDTILRQLTPEKDKIGDAMLWCAEHASCAQEVVETIYESLTLNETPLHKKIARLYLIVDVLANCAQRGVKDMFFYRQYFQEFLTKIFSALGDTLKNIEGRLKAETFKTRVMECFRVWEETALYPREILIHNQNIFLGLVVQREKEASPSSEEEDIDGAPIDEDDIDGVPLDESIYEDIKEDYAPEPPKKKAAFKPTSWDEVKPSQELSKWEMNEEPTSASASRELGGKKENEKPPAKMDDSHRAASDSDGEIDSPNALRANAAFEEERRKLLREVEVKALTYQDDLQADRVPDIKRKVEEYRQKLLSEVTQKLDESMKRERKKDKKRDKKKKESKDDRKDRDRDRDREKRRERDDERDRDRRDREERRDRSRERHRRRSPSRDRGSRRDRSSERRRR